MRLARNDLLARTAQGTRAMSERASDLSPRLRSVLFLINGRSAVGELLEQAGPLGNALEGQITTLIEMGLVEVTGLKSPASAALAGPPELPPVAGAKIELLKSLEASGSCEAALLADALLEARTLRELAVSARAIAYRLRDADGNTIAEAFWNEAKRILIAWRDLATAAGR
jgi:hypothetical protein